MKGKAKTMSVKNLMIEVLGVETIDETVDMENCPQWDSLSNIQLITAIEDFFDIDLTPEETMEMDSYLAIVDVLKARGIDNA